MDDLKFKSRIDVEHDLGSGVAEIEWGVEIEVRSWGVKSLILFAPDQRLVCAYTSQDENGDDVKRTFEGDLQDIQIEAPAGFGMIFPRTLRYWRGKWTLEFA